MEKLISRDHYLSRRTVKLNPPTAAAISLSRSENFTAEGDFTCRRQISLKPRKGFPSPTAAAISVLCNLTLFQ